MNPCPTCGCRVQHHQKKRFAAASTKKTNLYLVACQHSDRSKWFFKVGVTDCIEKRLRQLHHGCEGYMLEPGQLLSMISVEKREENVAHDRLEQYRVLGEWYCDEPGARTELVAIFGLDCFPGLTEPENRVRRRGPGAGRPYPSGLSTGRPPSIKVNRRMIEILRNDPARYSWPAIAVKLGISRSSVLAIWNRQAERLESKETAFGCHERLILKPVMITGDENPLGLPL